MLDYFTYNNFIALLRLLADIGCVWVVIYYCIKIVKNNSRTIQIFKGILLIFIIHALAVFLGLKTVRYISDLFVKWGFLAIIIVFQPEIRALLEKLGKTSIFSKITTLTVNEREKLVDELVKACSEMSKSKTGALISLEQGHSLADYIKTGTPMNSVVTSELLCSIFMVGTPLHDGAVIIQGVKIACAAAYFPPTTIDFPSSYGARHRAAVGISEITDSVTIVVSEETGNISIAEGGKLTVVSEKSLREYLLMVICQTQNEVVSHKIKRESDLENPNNLLLDKDSSDHKANSFISHFRGKNKKDKPNETAKNSRFKRTKKTVEPPKPEPIPEKPIIDDARTEDKLDSMFEAVVKEAEDTMQELPKTEGKAVAKKSAVKKPIADQADTDQAEVKPVKKRTSGTTKTAAAKKTKTVKKTAEQLDMDDKIDAETISYKTSKTPKKKTPKKKAVKDNSEGSES